MSCIPSLPHELLDNILGHCGGDKRSLADFTLVNHVWLLVASRYLFRTVHLIPRRAGPTSLFAFLAFVKSCQRAKHNLRNLYLRAPFSYIRTTYVLSVSTLQELLGALPRLRFLKLGDVGNFKILDDVAMSPCLTGKPRTKIQTMVWASNVGIAHTQITTLLDLFSSIDHLIYKPDSAMGLPVKPAAHESAEKVKLGSLSIPSIPGPLLSTFLSTAGSLIDNVSLKSIRDCCVTGGLGLSHLNDFIGRVGTQLEELVLHLHPLVRGFQLRTLDDDTPAVLWSLAQCPMFRRIVIRFNLYWGPDRAQHPNNNFLGNKQTFDSVIKVLESALSAPSLRDAELVFYLRHISSSKVALNPDAVLARLRELAWEQLNALKLNSLESLCISVDSNDENAYHTELDGFESPRVSSAVDNGVGQPWPPEALQQVLESRLERRVLLRFDAYNVPGEDGLLFPYMLPSAYICNGHSTLLRASHVQSL